jgi:hypothetical protein
LYTILTPRGEPNGPGWRERGPTRSAVSGAIPEIRRYAFGPDAGLAEGNFDFAVVADFEDADAYRVYAAHPAHTGLIAERIRPLIAERVAVQYETTGRET